MISFVSTQVSTVQNLHALGQRQAVLRNDAARLLERDLLHLLAVAPPPRRAVGRPTHALAHFFAWLRRTVVDASRVQDRRPGAREETRLMKVFIID